ncbi:unnamed protein product [Caenorhabditis bovis]|uniref:Uncharacterized protein n=1 Tax=Caenorhabditis bovis TaxID=2654633 RepID=A0A8S1EKJ0_9PELO|nr:unnamed protein product [Caenorhabditis bovis]
MFFQNFPGPRKRNQRVPDDTRNQHYSNRHMLAEQEAFLHSLHDIIARLKNDQLHGRKMLLKKKPNSTRWTEYALKKDGDGYVLNEANKKLRNNYEYQAMVRRLSNPTVLRDKMVDDFIHLIHSKTEYHELFKKSSDQELRDILEEMMEKYASEKFLKSELHERLKTIWSYFEKTVNPLKESRSRLNDLLNEIIDFKTMFPWRPTVIDELEKNRNEMAWNLQYPEFFKSMMKLIKLVFEKTDSHSDAKNNTINVTSPIESSSRNTTDSIKIVVNGTRSSIGPNSQVTAYTTMTYTTAPKNFSTSVKKSTHKPIIFNTTAKASPTTQKLSKKTTKLTTITTKRPISTSGIPTTTIKTTTVNKTANTVQTTKKARSRSSNPEGEKKFPKGQLGNYREYDDAIVGAKLNVTKEKPSTASTTTTTLAPPIKTKTLKSSVPKKLKKIDDSSIMTRKFKNYN